MHAGFMDKGNYWTTYGQQFQTRMANVLPSIKGKICLKL